MMTVQLIVVRAENKKGFTLIELGIVVFILAAFLLVAVPKFDNFTEGNLKSGSRNLSTTIRYLYSEAAFKKKIHKLAFDIDKGEYWVEILEVDEYVVSPDPFLRKRKLPDNVFFKDIVTQRSLGLSTGGRDEFILFLPSGFVEPVVIHLESESGDIYTLATKPYTGATSVFDEYKDMLIQ
jgi:prepilin-type N-terminal cleavage/methylation domain-containing protein